MKKDEWEGLLQAIRESTEQLEQMIELEQEKRQALLNPTLDGLEAMLPRQQAAVMQMESSERRRLAAQAKAGFEGLTGEEIQAKVPPDEAEAIAPLLTKLRSVAEELRSLNRTAMDVARANLRFVEKVTGTNEAPSGLYQAPGKKKGAGGRGYVSSV